MSEECIFAVEVREFKATNLTSRNRFKDKLKLVCDLDDKRFKTKKELIGGGDVSWKFTWKSEFKVFSHRVLEEKFFRITCMRSNSEVYGRTSVDLYTIVTGPEEHNLPLIDGQDKVVGRINFIIEMPQVTNCAVLFKSIKLKHLKPVGTSRECNPYLKYSYSKLWPLIVDKREKATYSPTLFNTTDPQWSDLPEIRFHASIKEILHESIVLHVTHHGKMTNTTLGRCNLLFRTLVDNGKSFKDEDLISFKGPLKVENAQIEGVLVFKFLPRFAQMKPLNIIKKAIHTEKGIFDALPLLPNMPKPNIPVINSDATNLPEAPKMPLNPPKQQQQQQAPDSPVTRPRSKTVGNRASVWDSDDEDTKNEKRNDFVVPETENTPKLERRQSKALMVEDLISFTPTNTRKNRSVSEAQNPFANAQPISPFFNTPHVPMNPFAQPIYNNQMVYGQQQQTQFLPQGNFVQNTAQPFATQPFANSQQQQQQPTFNPFAPVNNAQNNSPFNF
eukprot:TRINITY_DN2086_c0_g1_i2.p1 TRINITY_DN2086_c0_g1~~TRINITY_DN2086_c0_g1_i2.p1  ORF type:complete len:502 (-),score=144.93 TRINITY_DN2086_c0_g1_i2:35-1540(-)